MVAVLAFVVATPLVLTSGFHADDYLLFPREHEGWTSAVAGYLTAHDPEAVHYYRPGCRVVQQTLQAVFGTNPVIFHAWNLLLLAAASLVLYQLAKSITGERLIAGIAATLFLIHPAHDEPVMWITGISGLTDSLFHLAGLLAYDSYLKSRSRIYGWLVLLCFLIAVSHKESAASMLLTLPLLWWYRGHDKGRWWPIVGVGVCMAALAVWRSIIGVESSLALHNLSFSPLTWIRNTIFYLAQFLAPVRSIFRLIDFDYYYRLRNALPVVPSSVVYMLGVAVIGVIGFIIGRHLWRRLPKAANLGLGFALLGIAPLLLSRYTGLRLLYLSSGFLALFAAVVIASWRQRPIMFLMAAAWAIVMSASWVERASAWHQAGQINEVVLRGAVRARKQTPENTAAVYLDVPRRHIGAFLFPGAFAEAVRWETRMQPGWIFDYGDSYTDRASIPQSRMWYKWNGERFEEVSGPAD